MLQHPARLRAPAAQVFSPTLQVLQRSVEPVPATDGLIHLAYPALVTWWGYDTPVLAAAPGVVVDVADGLPDQQPVGTIKPGAPLVGLAGNRVVEDIGGGRYVTYAHLKPGSIPAEVRKGARLSTGELIAHVGKFG